MKSIPSPGLIDFLFDPSQCFGARVFRTRERLGLQQVEIAKRARISTGYYSQVENCKRPAPPHNMAARIVRALHVSDDESSFLVALARVERSVNAVDRELPDAERRLLATIRASSPLPTGAVDRLLVQLAKEVRP